MESHIAELKHIRDAALKCERRIGQSIDRVICNVSASDTVGGLCLNFANDSQAQDHAKQPQNGKSDSLHISGMRELSRKYVPYLVEL